MGGLHNSMRRLAVDGVPVVTGLAAVGDSVCTTNPTFGRGLALALQGATDLAELLDEYGEDEMGLAQALDNFVTRHVEPFYLDQAANDGRRLAELRHTLFGAPAPETTPLEDRVTFAALRATICTITSVSLVVWKIEPRCSSRRRHSSALVKLPLCPTASGPLLQSITMGCAFASDVSPAVE